MIAIDNINALREEITRRRKCGEVVVFVPTMGNLHQGHLALIRLAKQYAGTVLVSLYVNPLQFGPNEDFSTYPRSLDRDCEALTEMEVDILFRPDDATMYPRGMDDQTKVEVPRLGEILEGVTRPSFFRGVTTVVNRLFNIANADIAVFGKKDYQQLTIIKRMVADLAIPIEIVGAETIRDTDGLALSSRNSYLTAAERKIAPTLYQSLCAAVDRLRSGHRDYSMMEAKARGDLTAGGIKPDYICIRRQGDLGVPQESDSALVVLGAGYVGKTRLIDNVEVDL